ncbi:MFS transporter [Sporolactobacillus pectinivorans]|uniref:MFS transporter n=1 Tax=Sporolactobacillus pectinivorans TaxID=1591408 RepID=UPI000C2670F6|nr:MFS transporter [Sporolactobacillus pectinivorans]
MMRTRDTFLIVSSIALSMLIASLDLMVVTTSLPTIIGQLKGFDYYTWPLIIFSLTTAIATPLMGKMSDVYGFKPIYLFGLVIFLIGSIMNGLAGNIWVLIVGRGIQGIGGAVLISNSLTVVGLLFEPVKRTKYMGILGTTSIVAMILGPTLGGWITSTFDWHWIFWINIPIILTAFGLVVFAHFPKITDDDIHHPIDFLGAIVLILTMVPLLLVFTWAGNKYAWGSLIIIALSVGTAVMLSIFISVEFKAKNPIVPLEMFKKMTFDSSAINMFLINGILGAVLVFVPLYLQSVLGFSASLAGDFLTPMMISMVVAMLIGGIVVEKTGKYKLQTILGIVITGIGAFLLTGLTVTTANLNVVLDLAIFGFGAGLAIPVFTSIAQSSFPESQMGAVTAGIQLFKNLGQTIIPSLLSTAMMHEMSAKMSNVNWRHLPNIVTGSLKNVNNISNPGFFKELETKLPASVLESVKLIINDLRHVLVHSIDSVLWWAVALTAISLIVQTAAKEIKLVQKK